MPPSCFKTRKLSTFCSISSGSRESAPAVAIFSARPRASAASCARTRRRLFRRRRASAADSAACPRREGSGPTSEEALACLRPAAAAWPFAAWGERLGFKS